MNKRGERFLRGLIDTGRGVTRAYVEGLIAEDEKKEKEAELTRIANMQKEKPPAGFDLSAGKTRFEWDKEKNAFGQVASIPEKEAKPPEPKYIKGPDGIYEVDPTTHTAKKITAFPKEEKPDKQGYSRAQSFDDALKVTPAQIDEQGNPLAPAMQDVQPKADSLFNMQNFGQWDAPSGVENTDTSGVATGSAIEQEIIDSYAPDEVDGINWVAIAKDYPGIDVERIKSAIRAK